MKKIAPLIFSATLWFAGGNLLGWFIGQDGGYKRGITMMTDVIIMMMDIRDKGVPGPRNKYTDV